MGLTIYDENGKERSGEEGRFDREYYNIDEKGNLAGEKSFSERDQLIMSTYIAYDYMRDEVKKQIAEGSENQTPVHIDINSSLFGSDEYQIVGGVNGGRNKVEGELGKYQDTEGTFTGDYTNTGYDAIIVRHISTGEEMLVNIGSESGKGTENYAFEGEDWDVNYWSAQNIVNQQYIDASNYLDGLLNSGHNILYVGGNSLGGGNTNYQGYVLGDKYPNINFLSYNPAGIPSVMMYKGEEFPSNVYSIIGSADSLYAAQTGGGNTKTHMLYPKYEIFQIGIFGINTAEVDHRGVVKYGSNYISPAAFELLPFDLVTGDIISSKDSSRVQLINITPEVLRVLSNNYAKELDETSLINNNYLNIASNQVHLYDSNFIVNMESTIEDMMNQLNEMIVFINDKIGDIGNSVSKWSGIVSGAGFVISKIPNPITIFVGNVFFWGGALVSGGSQYLKSDLQNILDSLHTELKKFNEQLVDIVKNPLEENIDSNGSQILNKLDKDIEEITKEFNNFFPDNNNIVRELSRIAVNFEKADNSNNKLADMNLSSELTDGSLVNYKDYKCLEDVKHRVDSVIDDFLLEKGAFISNVKLVEGYLNGYLVEAIKCLSDSTEELETEKKVWESYEYYSYNTYLYYNTQSALEKDEQSLRSSLCEIYGENDYSPCWSSMYGGIRKSERDNAILKIDEILTESLNIEDAISALQNIKLVEYIVGVITYYKPLISNLAFDNILCSDILTNLNAVIVNNYGFNQVAINLKSYLEMHKSKSITNTTYTHKRYISNFKLWHQEVCDITVEDLKLQDIYDVNDHPYAIF